MKLVHIGLPKACSTTLQEHIFPEISKKISAKYSIIEDFLDKIEEKKIHILENEVNFQNKLPKDFIISNENFFSELWEFINMEKSFEIIKKNFSKDTTILIILRNPYNFLNSVFLQSISELYVSPPKNFFYINKNNDNIKRDPYKYNLFAFDYDKLVNLYKSYFDKVIVVKFEELQNLNFLNEIFDLDDDFILDLRKIFKQKIRNKSISKYGVKTVLFLSKFFNLKKYDYFIKKQIKPSNNILVKFKNIILNQLIIRYFFQTKFNKIIPYTKYYIDKKYIPINIDELTKKYFETKY